MFEMMSASQVLRPSGAVPTAEDLDFTIPDRRNGSMNVVVRVTGRTTGNIVVTLLASFDGGDTYPGQIATTGTVSVASGVGYLRPDGPLPPDMRIHLAPAGGFDGDVAVLIRSSGLLNLGANLG